MRPRVLAALVLLVGFGAAVRAADWPMHGFNPARTGYSGKPGPTSVDVKWTYDFTIWWYDTVQYNDRAQDNAGPIVGPDGVIYQLTERGLHAVNPNGTLKWRTQTQDDIHGRGAPALSPDGTRLYAAAMFSGGQEGIVAVNTADKSIAWQFPFAEHQGMSYSSLAVDAAGVIYIATTLPATVYAVNPNGALKWSYTYPDSSLIGIETPPAIGPDGSVYFIVNTIGLVAVDKNGAFQWAHKDNCGGYGWPTPTVLSDGTIVIAGDPFYDAVIAYNPNGSIKWQRTDIGSPGGYFAGVAVSADQGTVYTAREGGKMYALNAQTGATRWSSTPAAGDEMAGSPILSSNGIIYSMGDGVGGYVYAIRELNGTLLWKYPLNTSRFYWGPPSPALGPDGTLYAIAPGTVPYSGDIPARLYAFRSRADGDHDGDARADAAVYRPSTGTWFSLHSSTGNTTYSARGWGVQAQGDTPVVGDFDGDGINDPTVFRPATGSWFILESHANFTTWSYFGWGNATDTLVPGDYDGDNKTDAAVYRPSEGKWYVRPSSGATNWEVVFGNATDVPIAGDFDGDGKRDPAVYRPSTGTWFWLNSSTNLATSDYKGWGIDGLGDTPAPGDYDGDGKTDPCVFRPGTGSWFILESRAGFTTWSYFGWGTTGDQVVPADYDGDGATDGAIYRPSTGHWYIRPSSGATSWSKVFGRAGDVPLATVR